MRSDFLIVGSGIAALRAAAALAGAGDVLILTKAGATEGNTGYAQGGIAAAVGPGDSPAWHLADTLAAGDGLCDERAARVLVEDGPRDVRELMAWGAAFDRGPDGAPELAIEGAHSVRRVLHAHDATGREIGRALFAHVSTLPGIRMQSHARAVGLLMDDGRCAGVRVLDEDGGVIDATARLTLMATGGAGRVYSDTTNPPVASGDGVAIAFRAGAAVADLEFVQFHPTALNVPGHPRALLSEALRGEGARLLNVAGEPFMTGYDPAGDLAPRDRVARAIAREMQRTHGPVFLSLEALDPAFVHRRFPDISAACRHAGLDLARDRIPVGPAAHYMMGGVVTDIDGRTTVPGLFAAGEVACTGIHGANRLASNSLLEGLVFGARAGAAMRRGDDFIDPAAVASLTRVAPPSPVRDAEYESAGDDLDVEALRTLMWRHVGLFRDRAGLESAVRTLDREWQVACGRIDAGAPLGEDDWDRVSLVSVGHLIARAALRRTESRGAHFRVDFPDRDDRRWRQRMMETRG